MTIEAPQVNTFNALGPDFAGRPSKFFEATAMADDIVAELETLRRDRADVDELELKLDERDEWNAALIRRIAELNIEIRTLKAKLAPVEDWAGRATGGLK
jgi:hypothetical protein